jgi:putative transposase
VDESQAIVREDLNVAGMLKNHCLALSLADAGLGELHRQIQYKAEGAGKWCGEVNRFYASSKTCSACGAVNHGLKLSEREWVCTACGTLHGRDENAATNLANEGIARKTAFVRVLNACPQALWLGKLDGLKETCQPETR